MVRPANRYYGSIEESFYHSLTDHAVFRAMLSVGVYHIDMSSPRKVLEAVCSRLVGSFPVGCDFHIFDDGRCSVIHW